MDVVRDCVNLSSGTLSTLTGLKDCKDVDRVQMELVQLAEYMPEASSWMEVWEAYKGRCNNDVQ